MKKIAGATLAIVLFLGALSAYACGNECIPSKTKAEKASVVNDQTQAEAAEATSKNVEATSPGKYICGEKVRAGSVNECIVSGSPELCRRIDKQTADVSGKRKVAATVEGLTLDANSEEAAGDAKTR